MDVALPSVVKFCDWRVAGRLCSVAQSWRQNFTCNRRLIVPALVINASRDNYEKIIEQIYWLRVQSLVMQGSAMDLMQLLNQIAGIASTPGFMRATCIDIELVNVLENLADKQVVCFITATSNMISAIESVGTSLQRLRLKFKRLAKLCQSDLKRLVAALHGASPLELWVELEFHGRQFFERELLSLGTWQLKARPNMSTPTSIFLRQPAPIPSSFCLSSSVDRERERNIVRVRMCQAQLQGVAQRLSRIQVTEPPEEVSRFLDHVGMLVDALDTSTRGTANDLDDEMHELDQELSNILDASASAAEATESVRRTFRPSM